jgi:hypothetical protein
MKACILPLVGFALVVPSHVLAQTYDQPGGLQAGGLAPPPAVGSEPFSGSKSETEQDLDRAEREDSGRGLEFLWLQAEGGGSYLGLGTASSDNLLAPGAVQETGFGYVFGGAVGVRLLFATLGTRFRYGRFEDHDLWTLGGELGLRIPLGVLEPHASIGAGYAALLFADSADVPESVRVSGLDVRLLGGLDVFISKVVSVGGTVSGDVLFLSRGTVSAPGSPHAVVYSSEGSSVGLGLTVSAQVGLHF